MNASKPAIRRRNLRKTPKPLFPNIGGIRMAETWKSWPFGVRRIVGMTFTQALLRNRRSNAVMIREKAQAEEVRPKVPKNCIVADYAVVVMKSRNGDGAKGVACSRITERSTQKEDESISYIWWPAGYTNKTSRMRREFHVRFCERVWVKFPCPTRQLGIRN